MHEPPLLKQEIMDSAIGRKKAIYEYLRTRNLEYHFMLVCVRDMCKYLYKKMAVRNRCIKFFFLKKQILVQKYARYFFLFTLVREIEKKKTFEN